MLREPHPGKTIVITGVTRGLGRALAEWFIAQGHTVVGCGRGAEAILDLRFAHPQPHDFAVVDVAEAAKVDLWAEKVLATHGAPDLLINNAALVNDPAPLWEVPAAAFQKLMQVNVCGMHYVTRAFVPEMLKAKRGVIVNFSSGWGRSVSTEVGPYCASKWAVEGLTKTLAEELPAPLAAIPLNPGIIATDMLRQCWPAGASNFPAAQVWVEKAGPYLLGLNRSHNGESLSIPE